jgi:hypothetical protein
MVLNLLTQAQTSPTLAGIQLLSNIQATTLQVYLATGQLSSIWSTVCFSQKKQHFSLPSQPLFKRLSLVKILFLNTSQINTFTLKGTLRCNYLYFLLTSPQHTSLWALATSLQPPHPFPPPPPHTHNTLLNLIHPQPSWKTLAAKMFILKVRL